MRLSVSGCLEKKTEAAITEMENLTDERKNISLRLTLKFYKIAFGIAFSDGTQTRASEEHSKIGGPKMKSVERNFVTNDKLAEFKSKSDCWNKIQYVTRISDDNSK